MPRRQKVKVLSSRNRPETLFYRTYNKTAKGWFYAGEIYQLDKRLTAIPAKGNRRRVKIKRK